MTTDKKRLIISLRRTQKSSGEYTPYTIVVGTEGSSTKSASNQKAPNAVPVRGHYLDLATQEVELRLRARMRSILKRTDTKKHIPLILKGIGDAFDPLPQFASSGVGSRQALFHARLRRAHRAIKYFDE